MDFKEFKIPQRKPVHHGRLRITRRVNDGMDNKGERLFIVLSNGDHIVIDVVATSPYNAELVITAPRSMPIIRSEILQKDKRDDGPGKWSDDVPRPEGTGYEFIEDRHEPGDS